MDYFGVVGCKLNLGFTLIGFLVWSAWFGLLLLWRTWALVFSEGLV